MADITSRPRADIFCRVIDNYGDIGVCWRLARRLGDDLGWHVRLWVDDLHSFARLANSIDPRAAHQWLGALEVLRWTNEIATGITPGDLVIEAFACDPPEAFVAAMRAQSPPAVWINLEYLSAESWVARFHRQVSLRNDGLTKTFFFPGFTADTGGLLREPGLIATRDAVQAGPAARAQTLRALGLTQSAAAVESSAMRLATLFCYPTADLPALFNSLAQTGPWTLAIPEGVAPNAQRLAEACRRLSYVRAASTHACPALAIERFALLSQPDYDRLLFSADLNIVRGEDSFVRAQWAARPMLWHIYPQDEAAHLSKLEAWLTISGCPPGAARAMQALNMSVAWPPSPTLIDALRPPHWHAWQAQASQWAAQLAKLSDLADNVASYYASILNSR